jgi:hypothetical protein
MKKPGLVSIAIALPLALGLAGCCLPFTGVYVPAHEWSVIVRPPKDSLRGVDTRSSAPLDRLTCEEVCPLPGTSPGGKISPHVRSCHMAQLAEGDGTRDVVVCNGYTDSSCVGRSYTRIEGREAVAMEGCGR